MTDRSATFGSFTIHRTYAASPARVFAAWADAEAKNAWFGSSDQYVVQTREFNFHVGGRDRTFRAPSRFPASTIDLAFLAADTIAAADIVRTLRAAAGDVLEEVRTFDAFRSDSMGDGRRSLAFALRFRAPDRTLTDAEVGSLRQAAIDAVEAAHDAELRA